MSVAASFKICVGDKGGGCARRNASQPMRSNE
jgi:hypothetical protein